MDTLLSKRMVFLNDTSIIFLQTHPEYVVIILTFLFAITIIMVLNKKRRDGHYAEKIRREQIARMTGGESLYIVNPQTERFQIISQNEHLAANYPSEEDFNTSFSRYIASDVYEPDRQMVREKINIRVMNARLENETEYIVRFRDISSGVPRWYEMRAIKLSETEILYGFTDKDDVISEQLVFDKMRNKYFGLYYVNLDDGIVKIIINRYYDLTTESGTVLPYEAFMKKLAAGTVGEEAEILGRISDIEHLKDYFASDEIGYTVYKSHLFKDKWINLSGLVISRGEDGQPSVLGLGFSLLDDEAAEKEEAKLRLKESMEVVGGLANKYTALYHVNLETGDYVPYQINRRIEDIRPYYAKCPTFLDLARSFAKSDLVRPEDREALLNFFPSNEEVREAMKTKKRMSMLFKRKYNGEFLWTEISVIKCEDLNEEAHSVIVGFIEKDQEVKDETRKIREAEESDRLVESIASQYNLAYVVNMETDSFRLLKADKDIVGSGEVFENFTQAKDFFISGPLHPGDRRLMERELDYEVIRERLSKVKSYNVEYRALINDKTLWHEMNVTGIDKDDVAIGFGLKDLKIVKRHLESKRYGEIFALFEVDMDTEMLKIVKNEQCYQVVPVGAATPYSDYMKTFAKGLHEEAKTYFTQIADLDYFRSDLAYDDKHTFTYKTSRIPGNKWIEVATYVTLRHEDGTPAIFIMGFSMVDTLATNRQEVQVQLRDAYNQVRDANLRNELLYDVAHAANWAYKLNAESEVIAAEYYNPQSDSFYYPSSLDPMAWVNDVHPEDKQRVYDEFRAAISDRSGRTSYETTFRMKTRGGEYLWLKSSGRLLRHADGSGELIGMSININEQIEKEREQQLLIEEARNAAEKANKSKTNFLFNMSHDIRTPMNAITGFTNMAKKHIDNTGKVMDYLNKIDTSGQQLLTLINQVLEMARIESGKIELEEKPVNVRDEYDSAVTVLSEQAKVNGLEFHHSFIDVVHTHVLADTARMNSITLNITGNAMKYTPRGGRIDLVFREIQPRKEGYATFLFSVQDTGIGMSEEYLKVLFDPFTREKSSTVSKIQGTGLGMSIVRDLVNLLGGNIEVNSEVGKGTKFEITIDFRIDEEKKKQHSETEMGRIASLEGKRILLVEDNDMNREIATDILSEEGIIIEDAEDGIVAVELMKKKGPDYYDFILMDVQMPIMNGYEATREIRNMYPNAKLPIIALSANAFSEDREASLAAGMDDHVAKPIRIEELYGALVRFL